MYFWLVLCSASFLILLFIAKWMYPLLYKILKILILLAMICIMVFGTLAYRDAQELRQRFPSEDKLFLLDIDHQIVAGYIIGRADEPPQFLEQFEDYTKNEQNPERLLGTNYKLLLIKKEALNPVNKIDFAGINLTLEQAFQLFFTETPKKNYTYLLTQALPSPNSFLIQTFIDKTFKTEADFKDQLFAALFSQATLQEGPIYLIRAYREGTILIYPETLAFQTIKKLPDDLFQLVSEKINI